MAPSARFPRDLRLLRPGEFRRVFDRGRSRADGHFIVYALPREPEGPARLGLVVSRKFGPSVLRNLWKRRVRESFRLNHARLPAAHDLVVLPVKRDDVPEPREAAEGLVDTARRAALACLRQGPREPRERKR